MISSKKKKTILLTGSTGLLGSYLLKIILENNNYVFALARRNGSIKAENRVRSVLNFWDADKQKYKNLRVVDCDLKAENFGLSSSCLRLLDREVDEVYHCAAGTKFEASIDELRSINVGGTKKILNLFHKKGADFRRINYLSTAFVCGRHKGDYSEKYFSNRSGFNNNYEQSKFEAESMVRRFIFKGANIKIFRPSIIVGNSISGKTFDFKMFYEAINLLSKGIFSYVPINPKTELNLMPVDVAARIIYLLSNSRSENVCFHIVNARGVSARSVAEEASSILGFKNPRYISLSLFYKKNRSYVLKKLLGTYIPYFNFLTHFKSSITRRICNQNKIEYKINNDHLVRVILSYYKKQR